MKAWVIDRVSDILQNPNPLKRVEWPTPIPKESEILIKVHVCGICHTELDEIEGRTPPQKYPVVPGHQVVGLVSKTGEHVSKFKRGDRVGVGWIFHACGKCEYCKNGLENLCSDFKATGRDANGGYAQYITVSEEFAYKIPDNISDEMAAPLLCAGAIGYRSLKLTNLKNGDSLGLTGFGASGHIVLKLAKYLYPDSSIYVFARKKEEREFALELGAKWAGNTTDKPGFRLNSIIDTTPAWLPVTSALKILKPGGRLVINAIRKESVDSELLSQISYEEDLWMEKEIKSVANITSNDISEFIQIASEIRLNPTYKIYDFDDANKALHEIKTRHNIGAKVLDMRGLVN